MQLFRVTTQSVKMQRRPLHDLTLQTTKKKFPYLMSTAVSSTSEVGRR